MTEAQFLRVEIILLCKQASLLSSQENLLGMFFEEADFLGACQPPCTRACHTEVLGLGILGSTLLQSYLHPRLEKPL
jgi:hypothetical protein